jgi:hypothetical protein
MATKLFSIRSTYISTLKPSFSKTIDPTIFFSEQPAVANTNNYSNRAAII